MELHLAQDQVIGLFNQIYPISTGLEDAIRKYSQVLLCDKKQVLLEEGEVNRSILFIVHGAVRCYYLDEGGRDVTSWLLFENELAISVYSFFSQQPSFESIETLEDTVFLKLSHTHLQSFYKDYLEFNFIGRYLTEQYYIRSEAKANALRMLSAKERYLDVLQKNPQFLQRVPLGYLASYLGITQSTLSRIRASL